MHKIYQMVWSNEDCTGGIEYNTFDEALCSAMETLSFWACTEWNEKELPLDVRDWSIDQRDEWDGMIYECYTEIYKLNNDGEYEEYYNLTDKDMYNAGWLTVDEMIKLTMGEAI